MTYTEYSQTIESIKDMMVEIGRLRRENAALQNHCGVLTNRVSVLREELAIVKGCKPSHILLAPADAPDLHGEALERFKQGVL